MYSPIQMRMGRDKCSFPMLDNSSFCAYIYLSFITPECECVYDRHQKNEKKKESKSTERPTQGEREREKERERERAKEMKE